MTQLYSLWQNFKANFQTLGDWIARTATVGKLAVLTPLAASCWLIAQELRSDLITIEPIGVPKTLSDAGYTPEVAGYRLRDALNAYAGASDAGDDGTRLNSNLSSVAHDDDSLNSNVDLSISAGHELPNIAVPQIGLSLPAIASFIRSGLGMTGHTISGEVTGRGNKYALRLRIDGRQVFSSEQETESPDVLMKNAAPAVMEIIRPAAYAMARYRERKEEALLKADQIIAKRDPSDINVQWAYLLKGKHALRNDRFEDAQQMFSKAVRSNANSEQPRIQLGVSLLRGSKTDEAIREFQSVLAIKPKSAVAYNNIGVALVTRANLDNRANPNTEIYAARLTQAVANYQRAIAIEPGYALSYNNLGLARATLGLVDESIADYRAAIGIAPHYMFARWNLAYALKTQRRFEEAIDEYRAAIVYATSGRNRAMLYTSVGDVLREQAGKSGDLEPAIAEYRRAADIDCYGWAHNNLGLVLEDQGKVQDAATEYEMAMSCGPHAEFEKNLQRVRPKQNAAVTTGRTNR